MNLPADFWEKSARNARVSDRYNELRAEGKHGHYESMFRVVHEEVERSASEASAWWALVMGAAASIEDAGNCLRDPDAKKQADGAAKHYREAAQKLLVPRPDCAICGKPYDKHGTYPTCASHPYNGDGRCGAVGTLERGQFAGLPCPGAECVNCCVRSGKGAEKPTESQGYCLTRPNMR